ncbi:MAG: hypothetical protein QXT16_09035 [Candidatus Caldarchaeum sp.]
MDKETVRRNTRRVLKTPEALRIASSGWPQPPRKCEGKNLEEALEEIQETCPDRMAIMNWDGAADSASARR